MPVKAVKRPLTESVTGRSETPGEVDNTGIYCSPVRAVKPQPFKTRARPGSIQAESLRQALCVLLSSLPSSLNTRVHMSVPTGSWRTH